MQSLQFFEAFSKHRQACRAVRCPWVLAVRAPCTLQHKRWNKVGGTHDKTKTPMWILANQTTSYPSHQIKFLLKVDRSIALGDSMSPRWGLGLVEPGGAFDLNIMCEQWWLFLVLGLWSSPLVFIFLPHSHIWHIKRGKKSDSHIFQNTS